MPKTIIHISQTNIKHNKRVGEKEREPVIEVRRGSDVFQGYEADIMVDGVVIASVKYNPTKPLDCGARVWIETEQDVVVRDFISGDIR